MCSLWFCTAFFFFFFFKLLFGLGKCSFWLVSWQFFPSFFWRPQIYKLSQTPLSFHWLSRPWKAYPIFPKLSKTFKDHANPVGAASGRCEHWHGQQVLESVTDVDTDMGGRCQSQWQMWTLTWAAGASQWQIWTLTWVGGRSHSYSCGTGFQLLHLLGGPHSQCGYSTYTWQERFPASWLEHLTTQTLLAAVTHTKYLGHQPVPTCLPISQFKRGYRQKGCGVKELLVCGRGVGTGWGEHINSPFGFLCQMLWSISFNKHSKRQESQQYTSVVSLLLWQKNNNLEYAYFRCACGVQYLCLTFSQSFRPETKKI